MFTEADAQRLLLRARDLGATLVTTEKDRVRLRNAPEGSARARLREATLIVPVRALIAELGSLESLIRDAMMQSRHPRRR